ncbi:MAG: protein mobD [Hyphomicrobiales bacterium]|nr:protein mobD [Hyphomicrobiales bacterium]
MNKPIYVVGGSKGGVGKSLVTMALIHYLGSQAESEKVFLIDADTSNPDVFKSYEEEVSSERVNLDEADGWIRFVNICDENKDAIIVVNTAARNNMGVAAYGGTLSQSLEELERRLVTLWVINRQRDSIELLQDYMDAIPNSVIHVLKNGYFGADSKFELYHRTNVKKAIEKIGGKSLLFPDMADRVSDDLYSNRLSIAKGQETMPIGNRAELRRWLEEVNKVFGAVVVND